MFSLNWDVDHLGHSIPHALPPAPRLPSPHPALSSTLLTNSIGLCFADRSLNASLTFGMRQLFAHVPSLLPSFPPSLLLPSFPLLFLCHSWHLARNWFMWLYDCLASHKATSDAANWTAVKFVNTFGHSQWTRERDNERVQEVRNRR